MSMRVLCPVDFSECSRVALQKATERVSETGGKLFIVHVDAGGAGNPPGTSGYVEELDHHRKLLLEGVPASHDVDFEQHYMRGNVIDEIQRFARLRDIDLIVMGTHGRTGLAKALLGSVADSITRSAPCRVEAVSPDTAVTTDTAPES